MGGAGRLYTISIIDYLNDLTAFKRVESVINGWKFYNYGDKISLFATQICRTAAERRFRHAFKEQVRLKHLNLDEALGYIDVDRNGLISFDELQRFMKLFGMLDEKVLKNLFQELQAEDGMLSMR